MVLSQMEWSWPSPNKARAPAQASASIQPYETRHVFIPDNVWNSSKEYYESNTSVSVHDYTSKGWRIVSSRRAWTKDGQYRKYHRRDDAQWYMKYWWGTEYLMERGR
jgi:hypothetical protein